LRLSTKKPPGKAGPEARLSYLKSPESIGI
jgi:hypothetical protein